MDKPPTKFSQVKKALKNNQNITFGIVLSEHLSTEFTCYSQIIYCHVAPVKGTFDAKKLQGLMISLFPGIKPTRIDNFHEDRDTLYFGRICFEEFIGEEHLIRTIALTDTDILLKDFINGELKIERRNRVLRRIIVKVFPNAKIAKRAIAGGDNQIPIKPDRKRGAK